MRLPYSIAITLGFITCLSSFMLGLGQDDYMLPFLMFVAAVSSLYLTDFRRWVRLGDWTVNVLVLLIVFFTIGDIVRNLGEDLAFSIARTLVFVEMVLLFREKDPRFCWQILLISLLQVVVATVMQQSLLFGFLLLVYVFAGLCAFVQIFLLKENLYFRKHSFLNTFFASIRNEIAMRQDRGRLFRIALIALVTGPLSLVFSFSSTQKSKLGDRKSSGADPSRWKLLRSFFLVLPQEEERSLSGHWEMINESSSKESWHQSLWEDNGGSEPDGVLESSAALTEKKLVPVPVGRTPRKKNKKEFRHKNRFPLLSDHPAFSAGTMHANGLEGGRRELFRHLIGGTIFALLVAVVLFCFIPRIGKVEFRGYVFSFGHDEWSKSFQTPVGTVGFKEEIRLGSLGTILPYHREVMTVRFKKNLERRIPNAENASAQEVSYDEIRGATVYFRGVALDHYENGSWTMPKLTMSPRRQRRARASNEGNEALLQGNSVPRAGLTVSPGIGEELFFESGCDLVSLYMTVQPLDSTVFFAPWPFFCRNDGLFRIPTYVGGSCNEIRLRDEVLSAVIFTTAFKHGMQLPLTPSQERVDRKKLLQVPEQGLDALAALAREWDEASGLPKTDISGRAMYMEQQFLASNRFAYKLGGTTRDFDLDPLEDFIGRNPMGHCEYFAGALALMLRTVGIGSRVVLGYKTGVLGTGDQGCSIRQSDTHAWVEVFLPPETLSERTSGSYAFWWKEGGWFRLDPTPAANNQTIIKSMSFGLTDLNQWIQKAWGEFVLNMNTQKQSEWIYQPIRRGGLYLAEHVFNIEFWKMAVPEIIRYYKSLIFRSNDNVRQTGDWFFLFLPIPILAALSYLLWRLARLLWSLLFRSNAAERRRKASIEFYVRMERILARLGRERHSSETPLEYVRHFDFNTITFSVVDAFYRVRFGGIELNDDEIRSIRGCLDQLEKNLVEHEFA